MSREHLMGTRRMFIQLVHLWRTEEEVQSCLHTNRHNCSPYSLYVDVLKSPKPWFQGDLKANLTGNVQFYRFDMIQYVLFFHVTIIKSTYLLTVSNCSKVGEKSWEVVFNVCLKCGQKRKKVGWFEIPDEVEAAILNWRSIEEQAASSSTLHTAHCCH